MSVLKNQNLITKSLYRPTELKLNKITYKSAEKIWDQSTKSSATIRQKQQQQ